MFGWRAEEVVGGPLRVLMPERFHALHLAGLERARRTGRSELAGRAVELVGLRRDGGEFPVELSLGMWESSQGTRFSGVIRDITDRKHAEAALQQVKLAAEQANQAKSEYLSRMSHELRTPLNAILGFAQLLELDEPHQEQRDSIHHILAGAQHLLGLINEDLDIAAIEAGRLCLSLEPVAVAEVAAETVNLIRPLADHGSIQLEAPALGCQDHILADRQRLKQILLNLLSNAVKHNRQGGSVQFACGYTAGQRLRISVTDTGPGIAPEQLDLLFVPFERLGSERTSVEGSGLGLPVSKRLAQAMGGTLEVTTALGQGSTFWVEVPLAESAECQPATESRPHQEQANPAGPVLTVLYIEDNLSSLQLIDRSQVTVGPQARSRQRLDVITTYAQPQRPATATASPKPTRRIDQHQTTTPTIPQAARSTPDGLPEATT